MKTINLDPVPSGRFYYLIPLFTPICPYQISQY